MRVPRPKSGCDIKSLPLSPAQAFLLSRIDATTNERDLSLMTGLSPADVAAALDRLAQLGAIELDGPPGATGATPRATASSGQARAAPPARAAVPPPARSEPSRGAPVASATARSSAPARYDPAELDEPAEIDADKKRRILDLYYRLEDLTHYQVLEVDEQADKKRIKSAYYAMAPEFHPDRFFRKNIGSFKAKIEAVFNRVTIAHDILTAKDRRAEYDEYLASTQKSRATATNLEPAPRDVTSVQAAVGIAPVTPTPSPSSAARSASAPPLGSDPSAEGPPRSVEPGPLSAEDAHRRRETLARKLSGTMRRPTPPPSVAPPTPDPASLQRTADALRARHDAAVTAARRAQLQRHLDQGQLSLDQREFAAAANAYRIAASLAPDDPAVQATCAEAIHIADAALAEGYWKQALYEESLERWPEAALSYSKVCNGRPNNAKAHERVAFATLKSSTNARRAVEFARRAVELDPKSPQFRITLASAYLSAGLEKSALGEIDRAIELAPGDQKIKDLSQQVRVQAQKSRN
jgi:tetratricopeptide (TPR) repeat protein